MIKFVYFDVGGVVIKDFSGTDNWTKLMDEIGIKENDRQRFSEYWKSIEAQITTTLDVENLKPEVENKFSIKLPQNYNFLVNGFVNKFQRNKSIWPVIEEVKNKCRIGLLTGMYPNMLKEIYNADLMPPFEFDVVVDSSIVKIAKPKTELFELAGKKADADYKYILYVDNGEKNLMPAGKLGMQTFFYDSKNVEKSSTELLEFFRKNIWTIHK